MSYSKSKNNLPSHSPNGSNNKTDIVSYSSDEAGDEIPKKDWSNLPASIVEHVYSFLGRTDQFRMSLVCKDWSKEYESPRLWRTFKFYLPEHTCSSNIYPEIKFTRKFGHLFRHVEIICKRVRSGLVGDIFTQINLFLDSLTNNSQIRSLRFISLIKYYRHLDEDDYQTLLRNTRMLLGSQTSLEMLEFYDTSYRREEGAEILKVACESNTRTLKKLIIKNFVIDPVDFEELDSDVILLYCSLKRHFVNLTCVKTDYSQLLENIILSLLDEPDQIGAKLSLLEVTCEGSRRMRFQGIHPMAWKSLCRMCPYLKVHMTLISSSLPRSDYAFFIVPHIPMQLLEYHISTPLESRDLNIGDFFEHLHYCGCSEYLETLTIVWMPFVENLSTPLIPFLQSAKKLKTLQIFLRYPVDGIEDLFISWLERRPSCLESAHISVARVRRDEDFQNLIRLADEYTPLLQVLGLNVILVADSL